MALSKNTPALGAAATAFNETNDTILIRQGGFTKPIDRDILSRLPIIASSKTANYTLADGDQGTVVEVNSASNLTVTIPADATFDFDDGTVIVITRLGTGTVTVTGAGGVTIRSRNSLTDVADQYGEVSLRKLDADEWLLGGNLG